jgi:hypothetical protein
MCIIKVLVTFRFYNNEFGYVDNWAVNTCFDLTASPTATILNVTLNKMDLWKRMQIERITRSNSKQFDTTQKDSKRF